MKGVELGVRFRVNYIDKISYERFMRLLSNEPFILSFGTDLVIVTKNLINI